jgi:hypothetical protein
MTFKDQIECSKYAVQIKKFVEYLVSTDFESITDEEFNFLELLHKASGLTIEHLEQKISEGVTVEELILVIDNLIELRLGKENNCECKGR